MQLSLDQLKKELKENKKAGVISRAKSHQDRIKFHAETKVTSFVSGPLLDFLAFAGKLIPKDKFQVFQQLLRFPIKTNEVVDLIFEKLSRVFDGRNPSADYQFMSTEDRDDWEWYRQEMLGEPGRWRGEGWERLKTEINSVLIVDLPEIQEGDKPSPYFYWLPIEKVVTFEADPVTGQMKWIAFEDDKGNLAVFDDASYRLFEWRDKQLQNDRPISDHPHPLGYCPARFFWDLPLSLAEPDVKRSPISKELENLDWYLFYAISKRNLDLYGSYPIYSGYEVNCDYVNDETGDYCDGGFLRDSEHHWKHDANGLIPCPKCKDKRLSGAGSYIEVPVPDPANGQPDLHNPVTITTVDRKSLDYNVEECARLREEIINGAVGTDQKIVTTQAVNEKQVDATFESQTDVLLRLKSALERAEEWTDRTVCKLRYGDSFLSASISLGSRFFLYSPDELRELKKKAKESGASESDLDALQRQTIEAEYKNSPLELQRMVILSELEPFAGLSRDEVAKLREEGLITGEDYLVKANFPSYVRKFERENTNIIEFGTQLDFNKKIDKILETLRGYAKKDLVNQTKEQAT